MTFIKCLCIFINLSDLHLQLHLCDIDNPVVSHLIPEQSGHCLPAHADYLHQLRHSGHSHFGLNSAAWRAACEVGVALDRPTHRGCREVARKQQPIHVMVQNDILRSLSSME